MVSPSEVLRVQLRRDAGRVNASTGPWIRAKQVGKVTGVVRPDLLAEIVDRRDDTIGWGLYSEASSIAVRVIAWGEAPPPDDWLPQRIAQAWHGRQRYRFDDFGTTGFRVINSEGDGLPGLVVDRYDDDCVVQITTAPMLARREAILSTLRETLPCQRVHVMVPDAAAKHESIAPECSLDGAPPALTFREADLAMTVDAPPSQKTGAYFDQRANRQLVAELAARIDAPLLDVGCHVGGFALHARRAGVATVGMDQSRHALKRAAANAAAAGLDDMRWVTGDMFGRMDDADLAGPFGTIVFDPPKLTVRRSDVERARGAMTRAVARLGARVIEGGHLVLCTCSHHLGADHLDRVVLDGAGGKTWTRVKVLGPDVDHPVAPGHREGDYLVVAVYQRRT